MTKTRMLILGVLVGLCVSFGINALIENCVADSSTDTTENESSYTGYSYDLGEVMDWYLENDNYYCTMVDGMTNFAAHIEADSDGTLFIIIEYDYIDAIGTYHSGYFDTLSATQVVNKYNQAHDLPLISPSQLVIAEN